jgi:hypothetical protein
MKFFKLYIIVFLMLLPSIATAQKQLGENTKTMMTIGTMLTADAASLSQKEDGKVGIFVENLSPESRQVAVFEVPYPEPFVQAFPENEFKPVFLEQRDDGSYYLDKPGKWYIIVNARVDGRPKSDYFEVHLNSSTVVKPDDPNPPIDDSIDDQLVKLTVDLLRQVGDRSEIDKYFEMIKALDLSDLDLTKARQAVVAVRYSFTRSGVKGNWNYFFAGVEDYIGSVGSADEYRMKWKSILQGYEQFGSSSANSVPLAVPMLEAPKSVSIPIPVVQQQILAPIKRYVTRRICFPDGTCRDVQVLVTE